MAKNISTQVIAQGPRGRLQGYHEEVVLSIENKLDIFGDKAKWDTSRALNCPCDKLRHIMSAVTHAGAGNIMLCRCVSAGG